jgi:hypothetical protein
VAWVTTFNYPVLPSVTFCIILKNIHWHHGQVLT